MKNMKNKKNKKNKSDVKARVTKEINCPLDKIVCWECNKTGHVKKDCDMWKAKKEKESAKIAIDRNESWDELGF